jgi:hypothetical protein
MEPNSAMLAYTKPMPMAPMTKFQKRPAVPPLGRATPMDLGSLVSRRAGRRGAGRGGDAHGDVLPGAEQRGREAEDGQATEVAADDLGDVERLHLALVVVGAHPFVVEHGGDGGPAATSDGIRLDAGCSCRCICIR